MTRYLEFATSQAFQRFVGERAVLWPDWRSCTVLRNRVNGSFLLEAMVAADASHPSVSGRVEAAPPNERCARCKLGDLWKFAQPAPRAPRSGKSSESCLLLIEPGSERAIDQIIESAPDGIELLELQSTRPGAEGLTIGCLVHGEGGRTIAHSPPPGCRGFDVDQIARGHRVAVPPGWTAPGLLDELWPETPGLMLIYERLEGAERWSVRSHVISRRLPLALLLRLDEAPQAVRQNAAESLKPMSWRVIPALRFATDAPIDLENRETRPAVFRIRTYDRPAGGDAMGTSRGHDLGAPLLRILDECEAGLLPDMRYAAIDISDRERWHFLYTDRADNRLLDAWSTVERFDIVEVLQPHGLPVFISTACRMLPPVQALLDGGADRGPIVQRLRKLFGNPPPGTLVLVEAAQSEDGDDGTRYVDPSTKPLLIHLALNRSQKLIDVLPVLLREWNNAEPLQRLADARNPRDLQPLREKLESDLESIAIQEEIELHRAAAAAQKALDDAAEQSIAAVEKAYAPVEEAGALCLQLVRTLREGEGDFLRAVDALADFSSALTKPRRALAQQELARAAQELDVVRPMRADAEQTARNIAATLEQLQSEARGLRTTQTSLVAQIPSLDESERRVEEAAREASALREQVEERSRLALRRVASARQTVAKSLAQAETAWSEAEAARQQLAAQERQLAQQEKRNADLAAANRLKIRELESRRTELQKLQAQLEKERDVEIPQQEQATEKARKQLEGMDPDGIRSRAKRARDAMRAATDAVSKAEREIQELRAKETSLLASLGERRAERDDMIRSIAEAGAEQRSVEQELLELPPRVADARARLETSREALEQSIAELRAVESALRGEGEDAERHAACTKEAGRALALITRIRDGSAKRGWFGGFS